MTVSWPATLPTRRLVLRSTRPADADRAIEIRQNWAVARNLARASFPPDADRMTAWFATHEAEWRAGTAYRFAIEHRESVIGIIDIDDVSEGEGELGYWLDEAAWSQGFGTEAARAILGFGFHDVGLASIRASHAADNLNSGRILARLGFVHIRDVTIESLSRGTRIVSRRYRLGRESWTATG